MTEQFKRTLFIILGWFFVFLGILGFILPLMPGTVFLILALFFFAKSSDKFYQMLLENRWVGADLKRWQEKKCISKVAFKKAASVIILSFSISIALLYQRLELQILLLSIAVILLWYLWHICEHSEKDTLK